MRACTQVLHTRISAAAAAGGDAWRVLRPLHLAEARGDDGADLAAQRLEAVPEQVVPEANGVIGASRGERQADGAERDGLHGCLVAGEPADGGPRGDVPQPHGL